MIITLEYRLKSNNKLLFHIIRNISKPSLPGGFVIISCSTWNIGSICEQSDKFSQIVEKTVANSAFCVILIFNRQYRKESLRYCLKYTKGGRIWEK